MVALAAVLLAVALSVGACSRTSGTTEVEGSEDTVEGPLPTARDGSSSARPAAGSTGVQELIERIDALNSENDLCTLLTGEALAAVSGADIDLTSLLSDADSFTALFASLDRLFGHMVSIAPADAQADLSTMQGVWTGLSGLDPRAADAESRSAALIAAPEVQQAQADLGAWVQANCG